MPLRTFIDILLDAARQAAADPPDGAHC